MLQIRLTLILSLAYTLCFAQQREPIHSAHKASLYSAVVPGAGQFYNKKYWKIPVIYVGIGASLYAANNNNNEYIRYRDALNNRANNEDNIDEFDNYSDSQLITIKDYYRKNRDLSYIIAAGIYLFNIVDAAVDAHLYNFNVTDDLSMQIAPALSTINQEELPLLSLTLKF